NLHPINVAIGPTMVDPHVATVRPTQLLQRLNKCCEIGLRFTIGFVPPHQYADPAHQLRLLRARRERPRHRRPAEQRDELAPPHCLPPVLRNRSNTGPYSITSSVMARSVDGTSSPSALAVLRLITVSCLVANCTGRSAAFSPLRIRLTYPAARRYSSRKSGP